MSGSIEFGEAFGPVYAVFTKAALAWFVGFYWLLQVALNQV